MSLEFLRNQALCGAALLILTTSPAFGQTEASGEGSSESGDAAKEPAPAKEDDSEAPAKKDDESGSDSSSSAGAKTDAPADEGPAPTDIAPSLEDDLDYEWEPIGDSPASELPLESQDPVPPAHGDGEPAEHRDGHYTRKTRWLDITTDLATRLARDGGWADRPLWGGRAGDVVARGGGTAFGGDLDVELDGVAYDVPFAARGSHYKDLRLIPIAAIGGYHIDPSPKVGGYSGHANLFTRKLHGVEGGFMIGDRDQRRVSLAGGVMMENGNAMLAFESRAARSPKARGSEDLMSALATVGFDITEDFSLGLNLRFYRNRWDETGTLSITPVDCTAVADPENCDSVRQFGADETDGGDLRGTGFGFNMKWHPSDSMHVFAAFGYLEDRFNIYETHDGEQRERRDYDRVAQGKIEVSFQPEWELVKNLGVGGDFGYDNARSRGFATEKRDRIFQTDDIVGDWVKGGINASTRLDILGLFEIGAVVGLDTLSVRRTEARLGAEAQNDSVLLPVYQLEAAWEDPELLGVSLRLTRENTTTGNLLISGLNSGGTLAPLAAEADHLELRVSTALQLEDWHIRGSIGAYGAVYGRPLLSDGNEGQKFNAVGGDIVVDVSHAPTSVSIVARGGPNLSNLEESSEWGAKAPGVPVYSLHFGLLRRTEEGLQLETWLDAYGDYAVRGGGGLGEAQQNVSARIGWRFGPVGLWLGVDNLLDGEIAPRDERVARRTARTFYGMIDVAP